MSQVREIDDRDFQREVLEAGELVLVDFWAPWCGPCRMMVPVLDRMAEKYGDRVKIVKVNVDVNPVWANELAVRGIPSMFFFRAGEPVDSVVGYQAEPALAKRVDHLLRQAA